MIGQNKLRTLIDSCQLSTLPKSILLQGEVGSGRRTLVSYIGSRFNVDVVDISDMLTKELVDSLYQEVATKIYIVDTEQVDQKKQNILLKFLEEPVNTAYLFVLVDNINAVLPTVINRCIHWRMEDYSREQLLMFTTDEKLLAIANTPGRLREYKDFDVEYYTALADKIVANIHVASWPNLFAVIDKFDYKTNELELFVLLLQNKFKQKIVEGAGLYAQFELTSSFLRGMKIRNVDKKRLFEVYFFSLKELMTCSSRN